MPLPQPSRRTLIKAGAWSAPVIVAATAAPAFAISPDGLTVVDGDTRITQVEDGGWMGAEFDGFIIQSTSALAAGELSVTLNVSVPAQGGFFRYEPASGDHGAPSPWSAPAPGFHSPSITFTHSEAVAANEPIHLEGLWAVVATERTSPPAVYPLGGFTLTVVVSAPGATSVVRTFSDGLSVDAGLSQIAEAPRAPGYVGLVFDDFTIQSDTALEAGALNLHLDVNEWSLRYDSTGVLHDAVTEPWSAEVNPPGAGGKNSMTLTYLNAIEANVPVHLNGCLALVVNRDLTPVTTSIYFRAIATAPGMRSVNRNFFYNA